jgi:hypothetical protein
MQEYNIDAYNKWDKEALEPCKGCGRTFRYEALVIHQKSCKPGRPLKERTAVYAEPKQTLEDRPLPTLAKKSNNKFQTFGQDNADLLNVPDFKSNAYVDSEEDSLFSNRAAD